MKRSQWKRKPTVPLKDKQTSSPRINLKRKAWELWSKYIRARDVRCVTCGSTNQLCAGHFWHGVLDFDPMNINCQCNKFNTFLSGNLAPYSVYLINKYGTEKFKDLEKRHYIAMKGEFRSDADYLKMIEDYKQKLQDLESNIKR